MDSEVTTGFADLETAQEEQVSGDIDWARRLVQMLNKTLVVMRLYVSTNPAVRSIKTRLYQEIDRYVAIHLSLAIDITDNQLLYKDVPVFIGDDKSRSLPLVLHSDGLRQISFHQGISFDELDDFLRILHEAMTSSQDGSDTVGLLWNAGLTNIEYVAVDALEDVAEAARGGTGEPSWDQYGLVAPFADAKPTEVESAIFQGSGSDDAPPAPASDLLGAVPRAEEVRVQLDTALHIKLGDVLLDVLEIEDDPAERTHLFELLGDYIQEVVWEQKYADASAIIVELTQIVLRSQGPKGADQESLASLMSDLAKNIRARSSQKWFMDSFQIETSALLDLLKLLGPSAASVLTDLIAVAADMEQKTLLRNALCSAANSDISALRDGAANRNPRIAAEVARVVGKLRNPAGAKVLEPAIDHEDPTVRLEAARALGQIGGPESSSLLSRLLKDPDEEVRIEAANTIDVSQQNALSRTIADMVASRAFKHKTTREKMALVKALKKANPGDVVATITPFLRAGLFGKREEDAVIKSMINALALIHTDAAHEVLELGSRSGRKAVSMACTMALQHATEEPADKSESHEY